MKYPRCYDCLDVLVITLFSFIAFNSQMAMSEDFVVYVKQEMNAAETEFTASGSGTVYFPRHKCLIQKLLPFTLVCIDCLLSTPL